MKSPFPGMDPYLERHWRDVHTSLAAAARAALNHSLPRDLVARIEERVYVETDLRERRSITPDVRIVEQPAVAAQVPGGGAAVAEPIVLYLQDDPVTEPFIQILEIDGERVITAIEFLSPSNKIEGKGREEYLRKRREFLQSDTNLVEIDLVRQGDWSSLLEPFHLPPEHRTPYRAFVRATKQPNEARLYPIALKQRLPAISIPLRDGDSDVALNLQVLLDEVYEDGRYAGIDYRRECDPRLFGEEALWADELLRAAGKR